MNKNINGWMILSTIFIVLMILPSIDTVIQLFSPVNENWDHIKQFIIKESSINSFKLIIWTGLFTLIIGTYLAWLIAVYDFPLRNFFKWALILPMAIPPYIAAYTYNGMLSYTGAVQRFFRNTLEIKVNPKYFDIMSLNGAVFIFTLFLFPYVYMITKSFLEKQSASLIENARLLGSNTFDVFFRVALPISRGAIVSGVTLVILEVLNDYGVVSYFGVQTFSTAIFKTWFSLGDINSAVRLSAFLLITVISIILLEKIIRGRKKYSFTNTKVKPISRIKLKGFKAVFTFSFCFIIFALSFIVPTLQLLSWSILTYKNVLSMRFLEMIFNSLGIAIISTLIILIMAIVIANFCRIQDGRLSKLYSKLTLLGYSVPASVIAIAVILIFVDMDKKLYPIYKSINPNLPTLVLSSSILMLIFAYMIRFLAIGYQSIEAGFDKIGKKFFEASRMLGNSTTKTFFSVDLPMIRPALISAFALTFVDIIKELPLTLILRPFNFNTLATKAFEYANDEMIHEASVASLIIILVSLVSIFMLHKLGEKEK